MKNVKLVVFDLSGTTVEDDNAVAKSLHQAAVEYGLNVPLGTFQKTIGTNKIHLYQYLIAQSKGETVALEDFEKYDFPHLLKEAMALFNNYSVIMLNYYHRHVKAMTGAEKVFQWCHENDIKVATDTGFHSNINLAILNALKWRQKGLVDLSVDVEMVNEVGRPAPYMIFFAMQHLGIQSVHEVIKIGDTPADLLSGQNAGCLANIGVLSGANDLETLERYPHTHILNSVEALPRLIETL
ncbi:MAG: HAD family hydrolase [Bacteroidota bacterium]